MCWALKALTVSMSERAVSIEEEALAEWERFCAMRGAAKDWERDWRMGREERMTMPLSCRFTLGTVFIRIQFISTIDIRFLFETTIRFFSKQLVNLFVIQGLEG